MSKPASSVRSAFGIGVAVFVALGAVSCAAEPEVDDDIVSEDELSLIASRVSFASAVEELDEASLDLVDRAALASERRGESGAVVEGFVTRAIYTKLLRRSGQLSFRGIAFDQDLFKMNDQERALCNSARVSCVRAMLAAAKARGAANLAYSDGQVGGRIDAYRHTYWNAKMVHSLGVSLAKAWADAHENGYPDNRATPQAALLSDMDFANNASGRAIGVATLSSASSWLGLGSDAAIASAVSKAMTAGTLVAVRYASPTDIGTLVKTDTCTATQLCGK